MADAQQRSRRHGHARARPPVLLRRRRPLARRACDGLRCWPLSRRRRRLCSRCLPRVRHFGCEDGDGGDRAALVIASVCGRARAGATASVGRRAGARLILNPPHPLPLSARRVWCGRNAAARQRRGRRLCCAPPQRARPAAGACARARLRRAIVLPWQQRSKRGRRCRRAFARCHARARSSSCLPAARARQRRPSLRGQVGSEPACLPGRSPRVPPQRGRVLRRGRAGGSFDPPCAAARCDLRDLNPAPLRAEGPAGRGGASDGASPPPARRTARRRPLTQGRQPAAVGYWPTKSQTASSAATLQRRGNPAGHVLSALL